MADSEKTIRLKLEVQEAQANANIKKLNQSLSRLDGRTKEYKLSVSKLALEESKLSQIRGNMSASSDRLTTSMKGVTSSTGSATAAAMELGRVVSDAPYGIRGMANNVSQLASQLFFMAGQQATATTATKADTVAKGVNTTSTIASTTATVGFVGALKMMWSALLGPMGVLLAIQVVISSLDYFAGSAKKTKEETESLNESLKNQIKTLQAYDDILKSSNLSLEQRNTALGVLSTIDKDLSKILKENTGNIQNQTQAVSDYLSKKEDELLLKEKIAELERISLGLNDELAESEFNSLEEITAKRMEVQKQLDSALDSGSDNRILRYLKELGILEKLEVPLQRQKTLLNEISLLLNPESEGDGPDSILKGTIAWYNAQIKGLKEIQNEASLTNAAYQPLQEQIERYLEKINEIRYPKREDVEAVDSLLPMGIENVAESPEVLLEIARGEALVNVKKGIAGEMEKIRTSEAVAELITEQFKRETITATLKHAEGIFRSLQGLAGKNKALRASFIIAEKAASIGLMFQSYNEAKMANVAHSALLGPIAGPAYLKGANTLATVNLVGGIASTVAQTSKALSALGHGGAGGGGAGAGATGGGESREFDFNLVGSTGVNQLAEGVAGQFGQPIQAYVVSSQISSQQQLDGIIQSNATIGD
mgnify:CR=1 FL=1